MASKLYFYKVLKQIQLVSGSKNGIGNTFSSTIDYFPNLSSRVTALKHECILSHSFDKVLLACLSDRITTNDIDPSVTQIKTVEYYSHENLLKIFKEQGIESSIEKYKRSQIVNHSHLDLGPLTTPRTLCVGITAHYDKENETVHFFGKPFQRDDRKFFQTTKMDVVLKKGEEPKNVNAIPIFDWFSYYIQRIDEKKIIYTQIHMLSIGGFLGKLNFDTLSRKMVKTQGEKLAQNLFKIMNKIPDDAKIKDYMEEYSKLDEFGIPLDGSGRLLYDLNINDDWSK